MPLRSAAYLCTLIHGRISTRRQQRLDCHRNCTHYYKPGSALYFQSAIPRLPGLPRRANPAGKTAVRLSPQRSGKTREAAPLQVRNAER